MAREILFRGKRLDNGEWVEGFLCKCYTHKAPHTHDAIMYKVEQEEMNASWHNFEYMSAIIDPATVGQYTGLKDKSGQRIFEGDVLEGRDFDEEDGYGVVEWDDGAWEVISEGNWLGTFHDNYNSFEFEVIGNIHDNPELLGGNAGE